MWRAEVGVLRVRILEGSHMKWLAWLFAFVAGGLITCQVGSNSQLKKSLGQPLPALFVNYALGMAAVFLYIFFRQVPFPSTEKAFQTPWWGWLGGIFGAVYGLAAIVLASQLGAAKLSALVVTGQLICSVVLDHFGLLSFDVHPAGWARIAGCGLMVVGLILIAKF
ncbi:MAG TPA: DMT family transporter [Bryobacteraceae bacterium]|nr:DMT family transporter [Bryobacteraceae bacterium]